MIHSKNTTNEIDVNKFFDNIKENNINLNILENKLKKFKGLLIELYKTDEAKANVKLIKDLFLNLHKIISFNNKEYNYLIIEFIWNLLISIDDLPKEYFENIFFLIIIVI